MKTRSLMTAFVLVLASAPLTQALSITSMMNGIATAAESAVRLVEAAFSMQSLSKGNPVQLKLVTAVDLVEWHRIEQGEYKEKSHYFARYYLYDKVMKRQLFATFEQKDGKMVVNRNPFTTFPLEIRKFQCSQPISSDPALKIVGIDAGFVLAGKIDQIDVVSGNGDAPSQYPFTLCFEEVVLPAGCADPISLPQERRLSIPLKVSGDTYFILKQPGANCAYGTLPGILKGNQRAEAPAIRVEKPENFPHEGIQE